MVLYTSKLKSWARSSINKQVAWQKTGNPTQVLANHSYRCGNLDRQTPKIWPAERPSPDSEWLRCLHTPSVYVLVPLQNCLSYFQCTQSLTKLEQNEASTAFATVYLLHYLNELKPHVICMYVYMHNYILYTYIIHLHTHICIYHIYITHTWLVRFKAIGQNI